MYPQAPPKGFFLTKIFHPNVSKSGEICVNTLKKDWSPDIGLRQVFLTIRCLLIAPFAESALNEEAGRLLLEDFDSFARHARLMTGIHAAKAGAAAKGKEEGPAGTADGLNQPEPGDGQEAEGKKSAKTVEKKKSLKRL
jgi:ubiquitin-conjugating enzyme E2 S